MAFTNASSCGPHLVGVICPNCLTRAHTMVLGTGPQLVQHSRSWTDNGQRRSCRATWVATADEETGHVDLKAVEGRQAIDQALRGAAEEWLKSHEARQREAFERVFCSTDQ